jgi:peptidoglycan hydrolase CwlO-like protein
MSADVKFPELDQLCKSLHVDSSQMSLNIHDQLFVARIFDMHYNSLLDDLGSQIKDLYEKQTKDLAEVIITYHKDHMTEIRKLTSGVKAMDRRLGSVEKEIAKHERQIHCLRKAIEELHNKDIEIGQ